jgi:hypothetical protein
VLVLCSIPTPKESGMRPPSLVGEILAASAAEEDGVEEWPGCWHPGESATGKARTQPAQREGFDQDFLVSRLN